MPAERAPMRKIRGVLRLWHACELSERRIALAVGLSRSTVKTYVERAAAAGIGWPVPAEIDDATLERRLFPAINLPPEVARPLPDWKEVHKELKRRGVTLQLLWEEYRTEHAEGYCYSHFCVRYRQWLLTVSPTMRQTHAAGEKLFVDWAGATVPLFDTATGEERRATSSSRCLGHPITPTPKPAGARHCQSGLAPTSMRSQPLAEYPAPWCATWRAPAMCRGWSTSAAAMCWSSTAA